MTEIPHWTHEIWQGHTHDWPPVEERTEEITHCRECGHPWPTAELKDAQAEPGEEPS